MSADFKLIAPRPVRPGTLAVRQDWTRHKGLRWAIVSAEPLHPAHGVLGHKRGYGESHKGLYAHPFVTQANALWVARQIMTSGGSVWAAR